KTKPAVFTFAPPEETVDPHSLSVGENREPPAVTIESLPLLTLVGSANSGKTTLFNALTGSHYNTVNYPGATVEYALGTSRHLPEFECRVMDTPGLTSVAPSSPDEKVTVDALFQEAHQPDMVLLVADANQLSRHLYLLR